MLFPNVFGLRLKEGTSFTEKTRVQRKKGEEVRWPSSRNGSSRDIEGVRFDCLGTRNDGVLQTTAFRAEFRVVVRCVHRQIKVDLVLRSWRCLVQRSTHLWTRTNWPKQLPNLSEYRLFFMRTFPDKNVP